MDNNRRAGAVARVHLGPISSARRRTREAVPRVAAGARFAMTLGMRSLVSVLVLVVSFAAACTVGAVDPADDGEDGALEAEALAVPGLSVTRNVHYAGADSVHVLDVYTPVAGPTQNRPLVIWIHGGAFARDNRRDRHIVRLAQHTAKLGFVSVSIDYTLANAELDSSHPFPYPWDAIVAARADAILALRFLRAHASEYGIDPHRVAIGGASAGAMTALEVAYGSTPANRDDGIVAVVDLWGAMQTQTLLQHGDAPLLILHGTADQLWMPFAQAIRLRDSARAAGVPYVFLPLAGKNHGPWEDLDKYLDDITPFLRRYLAPG